MSVAMTVEASSGARWAPVRPAPESTTPRPVLRLVLPLEPAAPTVRLTRRGRLARTILVFTVIMVGILLRFAPLSEPAPLPVDHATTVGEGVSLSDIAAQQLPQLSVAEGVIVLQSFNGLPNASVSAGQTILVPRLP